MILCHRILANVSPKKGPYHLKLVPTIKETSVKISVLVTFFGIKPLIVAKHVNNDPYKLSINDLLLLIMLQ